MTISADIKILNAVRERLQVQALQSLTEPLALTGLEVLLLLAPSPASSPGMTYEQAYAIAYALGVSSVSLRKLSSPPPPKGTTREQAYNLIAYELGAERNPEPEVVLAALRARLDERLTAGKMLNHVCTALRIEVPEPRPDGHSSGAYQSEQQRQAKAEWDDKLRVQVRAAIGSEP